MNYLYSSNALMRNFFTASHKEAGPVNEIEMIQLASWEWFLLLSIVIIIIWLLILFQSWQTKTDRASLNAHGGQDSSSQNHSGDD